MPFLTSYTFTTRSEQYQAVIPQQTCKASGVLEDAFEGAKVEDAEALRKDRKNEPKAKRKQ